MYKCYSKIYSPIVLDSKIACPAALLKGSNGADSAFSVRRTPLPIDAARNSWQFYEMSIQSDLFRNAVLTRHWGRIGTAGRPPSICTLMKALPLTPLSIFYASNSDEALAGSEESFNPSGEGFV